MDRLTGYVGVCFGILMMAGAISTSSAGFMLIGISILYIIADWRLEKTKRTQKPSAGRGN
jgi:hypothetical protein